MANISTKSLSMKSHLASPSGSMPRPQPRLARHAYARTSDDHRHIRDTQFLHPAFSAAATPFGWLLKERAWGEKWRTGKTDARALAERWGIDSNPDYEPEHPESLHNRPWIQGHRSQKALLDAFFSAIKPQESLIFFYVKRTPLFDDDQWMIAGVATVTSVGDLEEWNMKATRIPPSAPISGSAASATACARMRRAGSCFLIMS
jgi:hypothetical protein